MINKRKLRALFLKTLRKSLGNNIYLFIWKIWRVLKKLIQIIKSLFISQKAIEEFNISKNAKKIIQKNLGVNIIGYINAESGVGELSRGIIKSVQASGMPFSLCNLYQEWTREGDKTYTDFSDNLPYDINLIVANADMMPLVYKQLGKEKFIGKYNIGVWAWELMKFPDIWLSAFKLVDEIWTISKFCKQAISQATLKPVINIPIPVEFKIDKKYTRQFFDIPKNIFVFLYAFDGLSYIERKNPFAVAKAYAKNFKKNKDTILIIKCHQVTKDQLNILKKILEECQYKFITDYMNRDIVLGLLNCCDCYISLHRAEGFGYMIAEAMFLGKQVIATNWSGNLDFMTPENSNLINYKLVKIKKDAGPYKKGNLWAEANIKDASRKMLSVFKNNNFSLPLCGQRTIHKLYSIKNTAQKINSRLLLVYKTKFEKTILH
ncbi:hypothetical protein A2335_01115 [Candidatus Peregrinibacteria bacterium RIFOXYB2_FULL_32_7]|nr:MAG: hypothetical protein A2335_01115 [Candidatus Peregrinibacteria bacterium RIFOXYB2_FULL_32_7]